MARTDREKPEKDEGQPKHDAESDQEDASQQQDDPAHGFQTEPGLRGRNEAERKRREV